MLRALLGTLAAVLVAALLAGFLLTTPAGARLLPAVLAWAGGATPLDRLQEAQAIVLLGGRTARVHFAARLQRETGLPLLVTGKGTGDHPFAAESEKMAQILHDTYGIVPAWVEKESLDTAQNAAFSWCLVGRLGIRRIVLVTDASHMLRSRAAFHAAGFGPVLPVPAPLPPAAPPPALVLQDFRPDWQGLQPASVRALMEAAGAAAMLWQGWTGALPGSCEPPAP